MRVLLDHCLPRRLRRTLPGHTVLTARDVGWDDLRNGRLLAAAGTRFDVLLTVDQSIKHQQNLATLPVAVVVIVGAGGSRFSDLEPFVPAVLDALGTVQPRTLVEVGLPPP